MCCRWAACQLAVAAPAQLHAFSQCVGNALHLFVCTGHTPSAHPAAGVHGLTAPACHVAHEDDTLFSVHVVCMASVAAAVGRMCLFLAVAWSCAC